MASVSSIRTLNTDKPNLTLTPPLLLNHSHHIALVFVGHAAHLDSNPLMHQNFPPCGPATTFACYPPFENCSRRLFVTALTALTAVPRACPKFALPSGTDAPYPSGTDQCPPGQHEQRLRALERKRPVAVLQQRQRLRRHRRCGGRRPPMDDRESGNGR